MHNTIRSLVILTALLLLTGCAGNRNAVPVELQHQAEVPGFKHIRIHGDASAEEIQELMSGGGKKRPANYSKDEFTMLSLSGGGSDGAFGAGFLCGWSTTGERPEFDLVTGISTGSLIAPFAFLGSGYDRLLKMFYTTYSTKDLVKYRLSGQAFFSTAPLRATLETYISDEMIEAIGEEFRKGRTLIIGTTNLDEMRPVYWDIGAIAQHRTKEARKLIRDVILASVAIPVAFPPVYIGVEANGEKYDEMHVDGGITNQVFSYPPALHLGETLENFGGFKTASIFIIRNDLVISPGKVVAPSMEAIATRSMEGLLRNQGVGDLYRIYYTAQRDGVDFNLAYIPPSFEEKSEEMFDANYMSKLFEVGFDQGAGATPWHKSPPYEWAAPIQ